MGLIFPSRRDTVAQSSLVIWNRQIAVPPSTMTIPDIRAEIQQMRRTEQSFRAELDKAWKGGLALKLVRWIGIVTAFLGLPGIVAHQITGWMISIAGFLGMIATEWKARQQAMQVTELDFILDMIDDRVEALNDEVVRRYERRDQSRLLRSLDD